ncbi:MAG: PAS domain-containing protein [Burkholderiaceae bacterium]|nr:PAS domain-containing protein [Burkholderiaceae bacterium]
MQAKSEPPTLLRAEGPGEGVPTLASGGVAAVWLDRQDRIREATASAAAMLGYEPQAMIGRQLAELAAEGWRTAAEVAAARVRFGSTDSFELMMRGRSGRQTLVEMTAQSQPFPDGEPGAVIAWSERRLRRRSRSQATPGDLELRRLAYGLLRTQEAERTKVAGELHDDVAPLVVMVKYMIEDAQSRLSQGASEDAREVLNGAAARLRDVLGELRRISTDLRPRLLDDLGLGPTLQWYCRGFEGACPSVSVRCRISVEEREIPGDWKLEVFRIAQEALANVAQHAHATRVNVSLVKMGDELRLAIDDDGVGFDPTRVSEQGFGLGLHAIRKRIDGTGGVLSLETAPHRGTRVNASWKLASSAELFATAAA